MTGTGGAVDLRGSWHCRAVQRNTPQLSGSVQPGNRAPLRLPSLSRGSRRRSGMARLSLSEPSLLSLSEDFLFEGLSFKCGPGVLQRPPPSLSRPCRTCEPAGRPAFLHISQPIQLRPRPTRRHSHNPVLQGDPRVSAAQVEPLSVVGRPCVLMCGPRAPAPPPAARSQLHVFLPSEAEGEGEEADRESVDEGFMDELDNKTSSLKIHQDPPQTITNHS